MRRPVWYLRMGVAKALAAHGPAHVWALAKLVRPPCTPDQCEAACRWLQARGAAVLEHHGVRREPVWSWVHSKKNTKLCCTRP